MNENIYSFLHELDLIETNERPALNIEFGMNHTAGAHLVTKARQRLYIKISDVISLSQEYECMMSAWSVIPGATPQPLGYGERGKFNFIVSQGYVGQSVSSFGLAKLLKRYSHELVNLMIALGQGRMDNVWDTDQLLDDLRITFGRRSIGSCVAEWQTLEGRNQLKTLPSVPQHSDFATNNLAVVDGRILVFDFEDYGKVRLPGFDLFILIASAESFDANFVLNMMYPSFRNNQHMWFDQTIHRYCHALNFPEEQFRKLIPIYLMTFALLKRNYGEAIKKIINDALDKVCQFMQERLAVASPDHPSQDVRLPLPPSSSIY